MNNVSQHESRQPKKINYWRSNYSISPVIMGSERDSC